MRLADALFEWLAKKGVTTVFMLPGGGAMHLCDALGRQDKLKYVVMQHEQAAAIAAESWGQNTNTPGVALVTSGPGATNAITGVAAAWIDSTPCIFISGQCKTADSMLGRGVRQMGSQEVDIIPMVKPITKYAAEITDLEKFYHCIEQAWNEATSGRKGPVWLSIPLDIQAAEINAKSPIYNQKDVATSPPDMTEIKKILLRANKPLILAGNGLMLSNMAETIEKWAKKNGIPVLSTWKTLDFLPFGHPLFFGCPGGMGHRYANLILQNCDTLLILGSRLDTSLTAFNHANFAQKARKIIVDIDENEINKLEFDKLSIVTDLADFVPHLVEINVAENQKWLDYCNRMKQKFPVVLPEYHNDKEFVNSYIFVQKLSQKMNETDVLVPESSGSAGEITYQAFEVKKGQKIKNAAGLGSMGFGLPYSIGACLANGRRRTILLNGDGAFQLNIQELETLRRLELPVKIFIWENSGYVSIRNMQKNLFDGYLVASDKNSGYSLPDTAKLASAYGLPVFEICNNGEIDDIIDKVFSTSGPALCMVHMSPDQLTAPRALSRKLPDGSMVSAALENMWPYLSEEEKEECAYR